LFGQTKVVKAGQRQSAVSLLFELDWQLMFVQNPPFSPLLKRGEIEKSPFVKGDLEGFSFAQHHFDETLEIKVIRKGDRG
jgi:hypothetical protein